MGKTIFVGDLVQYATENTWTLNSSLRSLTEKTLYKLKEKGYKTLSTSHHNDAKPQHISMVQKETSSQNLNWMSECDCFIVMLPTAQDKNTTKIDDTFIEQGSEFLIGKEIIIILSEDTTYGRLIAGLSAIANVTFIDSKNFSKPDFDISLMIANTNIEYDHRRAA